LTGIQPEYLEHIIDAFWQVAGGRKSQTRRSSRRVRKTAGLTGRMSYAPRSGLYG